MKIGEVKEQFKGEYVDIEVYREFGNCHIPFHGDFLEAVDNYNDNMELLNEFSYELMDEQQYDNSILANGSITADFEAWYDDKDAKVLCILVK